MASPQTMFEKIWRRHIVVDRDDGYTLLYVDRHLMHDGSAAASPSCAARAQAPASRPRLRHARPLRAEQQRRKVADIPDPQHRRLVEQIRATRRKAASPCSISATSGRASLMSSGPEQGITQPGLTLVCGDSPHLDPRRAGRARLRHRHVGGGACHGDAVPVAAQAQGHARQRRRHARRRRHRQGRDPGHHREDRRRRRGRPCHRICRQRHPRPVDRGQAHRLQHVDRGRRQGRHGGARRHDHRLSRRPALRAEGRGVGQGRRASGATCRATRAPRFDRDVSLDAARHRADGDLGHQPRGCAADHRRASPSRRRRPTPPRRTAWSARSTTWAWCPARRSSRWRSTASSSAPAPTAASRTCARPRRSPRAARSSISGLGRGGLGPGEEAGRGRGPATGSSAPPASNGASPAARCAWA